MGHGSGWVEYSELWIGRGDGGAIVGTRVHRKSRGELSMRPASSSNTQPNKGQNQHYTTSIVFKSGCSEYAKKVAVQQIFIA